MKKFKLNLKNTNKLKGKGIVTPTIILLNAISMYCQSRFKIQKTPRRFRFF